MPGGGLRVLWNKLNFDGRLWPTLKKLIDAPGELTAAYLAGQRKPYVGPFELFVLINVVFFVVQSLGVRVFSIPLNNELHGQLYSAFANRLLMHWLSSHSMTVAQYTPFFNGMQDILAKSLVILMVPLFALAVALLSRPRRGMLVHGIFAMHFYAFLMVFLSVLFLFLTGLYTGIYLVEHKIKFFPYTDYIITGVEFIVCAGYLYVALGRVYAISRWHRLLSAALLMVAALYILFFYRFVVFLATLMAT